MGGSNGSFDAGNLSVASPYWIAGRSGTIAALNAGDAVARLCHFGMADKQNPANLLPTPLRIAQIRMRYLPVTTLTTGVGFEIQVGTASAQHSAGGVLHTPKRRKKSGYDAIGSTETSLYVASTGIISGGSVWAPADADAAAPFDLLTGGAGFAGCSSIWIPGDTVPLTLEAGEALEVKANVAHTNTGIFAIAIDFLR